MINNNNGRADDVFTSAFIARQNSIKNKDGRTESYRQYRTTLLKRIHNRIKRAVRAGLFEAEYRIPVSIPGRAYVTIEDIRPQLILHLRELGYEAYAMSERDLMITWYPKKEKSSSSVKETSSLDNESSELYTSSFLLPYWLHIKCGK